MSNNIATANFTLPIDPECLNDMANTYAFWKYDVPPYLLGDKITRFTQDGFIVPEHYAGSVFKPVYITTLEKGLQMQKNLDAEFEKYKQLTSEANELIKTASNIENLISSVS